MIRLLDGCDSFTPQLLRFSLFLLRKRANGRGSMLRMSGIEEEFLVSSLGVASVRVLINHCSRSSYRMVLGIHFPIPHS